jgi:O-antigen/teichoic acid export membrane protein
VALAYFGLLWWGRDWVFDVLLRKRFAERDTMLLMWGAIFLLMVLRDQLSCALSANSRFRALTLLTLGCAVLSLTATGLGMQRWGASGALAGLLAGELASLVGMAALVRWFQTRPPAADATAPSPAQAAMARAGDESTKSGNLSATRQVSRLQGSFVDRPTSK